MFFNKQVTCVVGPDDDVHMPRVSNLLDYEGELAVVIGTRCRHVPADRAHEVIAGYTIANDVSVRDWQVRTPTMTMGKSFDTHGPLGPWIVTPDELGDPHDLAIRTYVNDELRQDGNTREMIYDCYQQVAHLSEAFTLEPGDVIATGTPAGIGAVRQPFPEGCSRSATSCASRSTGSASCATPWSRSPRATSPPRRRRGGMGALTTENELLWPRFSGPADLAEVERIPLSERGLPASTYELVRRAAELWPDRPAVSVLPDAERFHTPLVRTFAELAARRAPGGGRAGRAGREARRRGRGRLGQLRRDAAAAARRRGGRDLRADQSRPGARARHRARAPLRREGDRRLGTRARPRVFGPTRERSLRAPARERCWRCARRQRSGEPPALEPLDGVEVAYLQERMADADDSGLPGSSAGARTTSPATCTPAARPARRSSPRARTPTRCPTPG